MPLSHLPDHAQVDFGEAVGMIGGIRGSGTGRPVRVGWGCKIHFFWMDLPQSDAPFVNAYPAETTEAFLDGHVSAFAFFGGVPLSVRYDNLKIAVAGICGDGKLAKRCLARQAERAGRHADTIGERLGADRDAFRDLPAVVTLPPEAYPV